LGHFIAFAHWRSPGKGAGVKALRLSKLRFREPIG
jgi:hypothetical protein